MIKDSNFHTLLEFKGFSRTVATVCALDDLACLGARIEKEEPMPDVVEIRLDELSTDVPLPKDVRSTIPGPILVTARRKDEGGAGQSSPDERLSSLVPWLGIAEIVDVEVRTLSEESAFKGFAQHAADLGTATVASFHDFDKTPDAECLESMVTLAAEMGAHCAKIAAVTSEWDELVRLGNLVTSPPVDIPVSAMGMGALGKVSRPLLAKLGSALNYGYPLRPNANGQWPDQELKRVIEGL